MLSVMLRSFGISFVVLVILSWRTQASQQHSTGTADSTTSLVHALTVDTFWTYLENNPITLVEFYAPWCGHCKQLAPKYAEAAALLAPDGIPLASVDCIAQEELYWSNNIRGYPTLLAYIAAEPIPYEGPREAESMAAFMRELHAPRLVPINGAKALTSYARKYRSATQPVVLVFVARDDEENEAVLAKTAAAEKALDLVCRKVDTLACGIVRVPATTARGYGVTSLPAFVTLPVVPEDGEAEAAVVLEASSDDISVSELRAWVLLHAFPRVVSFREAHMDLMFSPKRPGFENHVLLFLDRSVLQSDARGAAAEAARVLLAAFDEQAGVFAGRCIFITVDVSEAEKDNEFTQNLLSDLNIGGSEEAAAVGAEDHAGSVAASSVPRVMIIKSARTRIEFYQLQQQENESGRGAEWLTGERIQDFVVQFFGGDIQPSRVIEVPSI